MGSGGRDIPASNSTDDFMTESSSMTMNSSKVKWNDGCHNDTAGTPQDDTCTTFSESKLHCDTECKKAQSFKTSDKYVLFKEFCELGLSRLGLGQLHDIDMLEMWRAAQPFSELADKGIVAAFVAVWCSNVLDSCQLARPLPNLLQFCDLMHLNLASLASQQGDKELSHQRDGGKRMCPVAFEILQNEAFKDGGPSWMNALTLLKKPLSLNCALGHILKGLHLSVIIFADNANNIRK